ncbi:MAG: LytR C-terminal domain-containing protein, partial [Alphaproteobacteria bacterium]
VPLRNFASLGFALDASGPDEDARIAPRNLASVAYVFEGEGDGIAVPLRNFASLGFALDASGPDEDARIAPRNLASVAYVFEGEGDGIAAQAEAMVGYWVQIGSFRASDDALRHGDELARAHGDLFADLGVEVRETDLGPERGVYFRTVSQRLGLSGARELCRALLAREVDCFIDGPRIEIANGVGRLETAARLDLYLEAKGVYVGALTNDARFDHETTVIFYSEGFEGEAAALARLLPFEAAIEPESTQAVDIRVRLGSDMLGFERALAALSGGEAA